MFRVKVCFALLLLTFGSFTELSEAGHTQYLGQLPFKWSPNSHLEFLDPERRYRLEWEVDWEHSRIVFGVTVQTTGYIGFGLSRRGDVAGADIVIAGIYYDDGSPYISDQHGTANGELEIDPSQDWQVHSGWENYTHTHLTFSRAFDTCDDPHDYPIDEHDVVYLIWAYGLNDDPEGFLYGKRGQTPVYLLDPEFVPKSIKEASFSPGPSLRYSKEKLQVWTVSSRYRLPTNETAYICTIHQGPRLHRKHHIVGYEMRLETEEARRHVHHFLLYRCTPPENMDPVQFFGRHLNNPGEACYFLGQPTGQIPTQYCTEVVGGWAIGGKIWFLPHDLGYAFGESFDEFFSIQIHYDNQEMLSNVNVEVNFDVYYTSELRETEVGVITMGHHIPGSPSILIPPSSTDHRILGFCGSDCTRTIFPPEGVTIAAILLHTHNSGAAIRTRHFRGTQELPWIEKDDNYSNQFQPFRVLQDRVHVQQGDHITIECTFNNTWTTGTVVGGFSTNAEMCLVYVYYYNKVPGYSLCRSEITSPEYRRAYLGVNNITWSQEDLEFTATSPFYIAGRTITQISDSFLVNWLPTQRAQLQQDHLELTQTSACSRSPFSSSGEGQVQGNDGDMTFEVTQPRTSREYVQPTRNLCKRQKAKEKKVEKLKPRPAAGEGDDFSKNIFGSVKLVNSEDEIGLGGNLDWGISRLIRDLFS